MENEKIWESITNKITGEANSDEEAIVKEWLEKKKSNKKIFDRLVQIWQYHPNQVYDTSVIYRKYQQRKNQFGNKKIFAPLVYYALRISAVLFFIVSTTFLFNHLSIFSNGKIVYQEISVTKGSRSSLILPDGTKVWLSNNSTLKFPTVFNRNIRELELKGEAYFEVVHDKEKPFVVNIGKNRIKVLGTVFSISAYPEDNTVRADLISGKIQFDISNNKGGYNSFFVKPLHSLILDRSSGKFSESKVPDGLYEYWHSGTYVFRNETLVNLAIKIDRIYNAQLVFEDDQLKTKRFSGVMSINDNIFTFMEAIKTTSLEPIDYRFENNKLYVKLK